MVMAVLRRLFVLVVFSSALAVEPALAASASLVTDLNAGREGTPEFGPIDLLTLNDRLIFTAFDPSSGRALWVSDGTAHGTEVLQDFCAGSCSGEAKLLGAIGKVAFVLGGTSLWRTDGTRAGTFLLDAKAELNHESSYALSTDRLFFGACTPHAGCELWSSDGTVGGTGMVKELVPGPGGGVPREMTFAGSRLFFVAYSEAGPSLWTSDGTAAGTRVLHRLDIVPSRYPLNGLTAAGDRLFFLNHRDGDGEELWSSDGTAAGTRPLTAFAAPAPFEESYLKALGDKLYFPADDGTGGNDLWVSDGTVAGTRRVTDFGYASPFSTAGSGNLEKTLEQVGGRLIFVANDGISGFRLWTSGGTPQTTAALTGCPGGCPTVPENAALTRVGSRVLFEVRGPDRGGLWSSDGTGAGTRLIRAIVPSELAVLHGKAYFAAPSGLWRSDGTAAGTSLVAAASTSPHGMPPEIAAVGSRLFFVVSPDGYVRWLWSSDGTPAGSEQVTVLGEGGASSSPRALTRLGQGVLFTACDGVRRSLWWSDGTASGTRSLPAVSGGVGCGDQELPRRFTIFGDLAFFTASEQEFLPPYTLWRTDGTAAGTFPLTDLADGTAGEPLVFAGRLIFPMYRSGGNAVWTTDGTAAGTVELFDLPPEAYQLRHLTAVGSELYFISEHPDFTLDFVWRSDGTAAGTRSLRGFAPYAFNSLAASLFVRMGGYTHFIAAGDFDSPIELWRTDGTSAGTRPIPGPAGDLTAFAGGLYFFDQTETLLPQWQLWRRDGTASGTVLLGNLAPHALAPYTPHRFTPYAGELYFPADDGEHGGELWKTDGTAAGTVLVKDIAPGALSSSPSSLVAAGGLLYFTATDGVHGFELWQSDGTAAGTRMVQDLAPGGGSSTPEEPTATAGQLFFAADDRVWGRELWSYPLLPAPSCQPAATTLCLAGSRYKVEAHWRDFAGNSGAGRAVALTADTGYFWFFDAANVEVILKVLAAEGVNGHTWVFYGALSSVEYTLTVTDTQTGAARRYVNPASRLGSVADTHAFGPLGATPSSLTLGPEAEPASVIVSASRSRDAAATAPCVPSPTRLCLNGGRFAVEARWRAQGKDGVGTAVPLTGDTGYFWFFGAANVEIVVKVLDGRPLNGKFWVFYGALSDVAYTLRVTDTQTGETKTYENPQGRLASVADTGAF